MSRSTYLIGVQTVDVTPDTGGHLAGFDSRSKPSTHVDRRLRATCISMDDGTSRVLLVCIDWLGFYGQTAAARARIGEATGLSATAIILNASHSHNGPCMRPLDLTRGHLIDQAFIDRSLVAIAEAAAAAMATAVPCTLSVGEGWCGFAASRRKILADGSLQWAPTRDSPADHRVPVLIADDANGARHLTLFGYACHPTGAGASMGIGSGYTGYAVDAVEAATGATAAFIQGCAGDQKPFCPNEMEDGFRLLSQDEIRGLGERLAAAAGRASMSTAMRPVTGRLDVDSLSIDLLAEPAGVAEWQTAAASAVDTERAWGEHFLAMAADGPVPADALPFELQALRIGGSLAVVFMAAEMSVEHGLRLCHTHGHRYDLVWPAGYANDMIGYIPVRRQLAEGGYEVDGNSRILMRPGRLADDTEDRIHAAIAELLAD